MTLAICMVICSAFMCTALAIVSPFPHARTIDDLVLELEETNPCCSTCPWPISQCTLYMKDEGKPESRRGYPVQDRDMVPQDGVRVDRAALLAIIGWVSLVMTIVSACFLIYEVLADGFLFHGSVLPLALTIAFPLLSNYAEQRMNL